MEIMKCDRCGKVHEKCDSKLINYGRKEYDLCPDCYKSLGDWITKKD